MLQTCSFLVFRSSKCALPCFALLLSWLLPCGLLPWIMLLIECWILCSLCCGQLQLCASRTLEALLISWLAVQVTCLHHILALSIAIRKEGGAGRAGHGLVHQNLRFVISMRTFKVTHLQHLKVMLHLQLTNNQRHQPVEPVVGDHPCHRVL